MSEPDQGPDPYRPMRAALDQPPAAAAAPASADPRPLSENARVRALLPIGRSGFAIAAGYLGLFSLIPFVGVLAIAFGLLAIRHIRRNPQRHGMGRAIFGIAAGAVTLLAYGYLFLGASFG